MVVAFPATGYDRFVTLDSAQTTRQVVSPHWVLLVRFTTPVSMGNRPLSMMHALT